MKTKLVAVSAAALMMMGLFGAANANAAPGPNGNNDRGLCTAYFNGSDTGREKKSAAPPFVALVAAAGEAGVEAFCGVVRDPASNDVADNGQVGGNPDFE